MTAWRESAEFDGSGFDLEHDLAGAFRAGLLGLHAAAKTAGLGHDSVDAVVGAAWDAFTGFTAHEVADYNAVVTLAIGANGWDWTEAVLIDPTRREESFRRVTAGARLLTGKLFPRLPEADREAAADDAMVGLSRLLLDDPRCGFRMPAWTSWAVVKRNVRWRLLDAAERFDSSVTCGGDAVLSLDAYWEAIGEHGVSGIEYGSSSVDDRGVEAVVWAMAGKALAVREGTMLAGSRSGAARDKVALTIQAARWVLARGAEDDRDESGEFAEGSAEEIRHQFAQDALLVCFHGLRSVAPQTWGRYPADKVPTRELFVRAAGEAAARGDVNAGWFACLEARRVDVAKGDRLLHGVRRLVETLLEEAAHGDGD